MSCRLQENMIQNESCNMRFSDKEDILKNVDINQTIKKSSF